MSKTLFYSAGLIGGSLILALVYIWSIQPDTKQDTAQVSSRYPTQDVVTSNDVSREMLNEKIDSLLQRFTKEQKALREQLDALQATLQAHIEESETAQNTSALDADSWPEERVESYREPITAQELRTRIAQADFSQEEAIASQLDAEEADPDWSDQAEAEIRAAFQINGNLNAQLNNVVCRSTFCRIEGTFGDADSRNRSISELMALVPWEAQAFYHGDEQEGVTGAIYILREGVTELPNIQ